MVISHIDHFVLTVRSLEVTCEFYERVLCMKRINALGQPTALTLKNQKINIHEAGRTFDPKARFPTPGAGDFCFIAVRDIAEVRSHIQSCGVAIEVGPVRRIGAQGAITSLMRLAGMVQMALARSNSLPLALRTSLERVTVRIVNSSASAARLWRCRRSVMNAGRSS